MINIARSMIRPPGLKRSAHIQHDIKKVAFIPGIAFIIVSKRINTRFFAMERGTSNPPSAICIQTVKTRYFFCQIQLKGQDRVIGKENPKDRNTTHSLLSSFLSILLPVKLIYWIGGN